MAGEQPLPPSLVEQRRALLDHFHLSVRLHGEQSASRQMRKFGIKFAIHHPDPEAVRSRFIAVRSIDEWNGVLDEFYSEDGRDDTETGSLLRDPAAAVQPLLADRS